MKWLSFYQESYSLLFCYKRLECFTNYYIIIYY